MTFCGACFIFYFWADLLVWFSAERDESIRSTDSACSRPHQVLKSPFFAPILGCLSGRESTTIGSKLLVRSCPSDRKLFKRSGIPVVASEHHPLCETLDVGGSTAPEPSRSIPAILPLERAFCAAAGKNPRAGRTVSLPSALFICSPRVAATKVATALAKKGFSRRRLLGNKIMFSEYSSDDRQNDKERGRMTDIRVMPATTEHLEPLENRDFGTTSVQMKREKHGFLVPKRHRMIAGSWSIGGRESIKLPGGLPFCRRFLPRSQTPTRKGRASVRSNGNELSLIFIPLRYLAAVHRFALQQLD
jgi:hypothetical protein